MRVHVHECRAIGLTDDGDSPARPPRRRCDAARRRRRARLRAPRRHPDRRELDLAARAAAAGLRYLPPEQTTDSDLSGIAARRAGDRAGHRAGVRRPRGAAVRGPRRALRARDRDGELRYVPSGREPVLHVGSPRGLALPREDRVRAARRPPELPRFLGPAGRRPAGRARRGGPAHRGVAADGQGDRLGLVPRAAARPPRPRPARRRHLHRPVRRRGVGLPGDGGAARRGGARPGGPDRLRRAGPPAGRRARRLARRAAAAGARRTSPTTCTSTSTPRTPRTSARSWRCCRCTRRSRPWSPRAR